MVCHSLKLHKSCYVTEHGDHNSLSVELDCFALQALNADSFRTRYMPFVSLKLVPPRDN